MVTTTTTGPTGSTALLAPGGMVTALMGTALAPSLYTIMGIQPGDNLVVVDWSSLASLPGAQPGMAYSSTVNFTSVPASPPAGTTQLSFEAGGYCNAGAQLPFTPPATTTLETGGFNGLEPSCLGVGRFGATYGAAYPALVEAKDGNGSLLGFAFAKGNAVTTLDDAGALDVAIGGTWSTSTTAQTLSVTNVPGTTNPWVFYSEVADGTLFSLPQRTPPDGGLPSGTTLYTTHPGYADFVQSEVGSYPGSSGFVMMATRGPAPTADATSTVDSSPLWTLPSFSALAVDQAVPAQPKVGWTTADDLTKSTAVIVYTTWNAADPEGGTQQGSWTLVSPGLAQAALQVPALPAAYGSFAPLTGANVNFSTVSAVQGGTALPGYAQVRAASSVFSPLVRTSCLGYFGPAIPPLPADGTLAVSSYGGGCG